MRQDVCSRSTPVEERGRKQEWGRGSGVGCSGQGLLVESIMLGTNGWCFTLPNARLWEVAHPKERHDLKTDSSLQLRCSLKSWWLEAVFWPPFLQLGSETFLEGDLGSAFLSKIQRQNWFSVLPKASWLHRASWHLMSSRQNYKEADCLSPCSPFLLPSLFSPFSPLGILSIFNIINYQFTTPGARNKHR